MAFKEDSYEVVRNAITEELVIFINSEFELLRKLTYMTRGLHPDDEENRYTFNDTTSEKCFGQYSPFCTETLMLFLHKKAEEVTGKNLLPAYSYARQYYKGATMGWHTDRYSCEYSITICLSRPEDLPYPIWFETKTLPKKDVEIILNPGDMIVYKGAELPHWRLEYQGERMTQAFLHYVDADGPHSNRLFDTRPYLGYPSSMQKEPVSDIQQPKWKTVRP